MDELTKLYSPSCWVPGKTSEEVMNEWIAGTGVGYQELKASDWEHDLDVTYGEEENQKVDIWGTVNKKLLIFIHGGYWAAGTRKDAVTPAFCALSNGFAFASVGYGLATKDHPLSAAVDDVVKGVQFLLNKFPNADNVIIGGHSAGAHLAFHAVTKVRDPRITGLLIFSACFFLDELVPTQIGKDISLTPEEALKNTCQLGKLDDLQLRIHVILGLREAPKLIEQNRRFQKERSETTTICELPDETHFTIMINMLIPDSEVYESVKNFLEGF